MISVLLATYNRLPKLKRALESLLKQETSREYQILIANDGSTDGTREFLQEVEQTEKRIKLVVDFDWNMALPNRLYNGLATLFRYSEFFSFAFDDDWVYPNYIETLASFLEIHPKVEAVWGRVEGIFQGKVRRVYCQRKPDLSTQIRDNELPLQGLMIRRKSFFKLGGFDTSELMQSLHDWDFANNIVRNCQFEVIPEIVAVWDFTNVSTSLLSFRFKRGPEWLQKVNEYYDKKWHPDRT